MSSSTPRIVLFVVLLIYLLNVDQSLASHGYRRQMGQMRQMAQKAYEHGMRINEQAQCGRPRPELIYLTDSNKIFLPRATLLHRCSDLTGCCAHATHSCQPSASDQVNLYFFTISVQSTSRVRQNQNIEVINFVNHTECSCIPVDRMRSELIQQNISLSRLSNMAQPAPMLYSNSRLAQINQNDARSSTTQSDNNIDSDNDEEYDDEPIENNVNQTLVNYWTKLLGLYKANGDNSFTTSDTSLSSAKTNQISDWLVDPIMLADNSKNNKVSYLIEARTDFSSPSTFVPRVPNSSKFSQTPTLSMLISPTAPHHPSSPMFYSNHPISVRSPPSPPTYNPFGSSHSQSSPSLRYNHPHYLDQGPRRTLQSPLSPHRPPLQHYLSYRSFD